jgi:hypothetical protein
LTRLIAVDQAPAPMPKPSTLLKYFAIITGGALVLSIAFFFYMILGAIGLVWTPYTCLTDVLGQTSTSAEHYFEVGQTSCSGIGKGPAEISVFASKAKRGKKALIFKYERTHDGSREAEPVITPVDGRTVLISVKHIASLICRAGRWENLAIEYDIGRLAEDDGSRPSECIQD